MSDFKIFISYRRDDSEDITGRLYDRLQADLQDATVFIDIDDIPLGIDFRQFIDQQVSQCHVLLAIIGQHWLTLKNQQGQRRIDDPRDFVHLEIQSALQRNIPVVPVLVRSANMPNESDLPNALAELAFRNAIELRSGRDFHGHATRLINRLEKDHLAPVSMSRSKKIKTKVTDQPPVRESESMDITQRKSFEPEMVSISEGAFEMGDISGNGYANELPVHDVEIQSRFAVSRYPITVGEFKAFVQRTGFKTEAERDGGAYVLKGKDWVEDKDASWKNPGFIQTDRHPVVCVSFNDAQEYIKWLKLKTGRPYRLLTEAEWEYVCRAGTETDYYWGNEIDESQAAYGAYDQSTRYRSTVEVGSFKPNTFGVYDMHGNVWEWVEDHYHESYEGAPADGSAWLDENDSNSVRVLRGGSWYDTPGTLRASSRVRSDPGDRFYTIGFRVAQDPMTE